MGNWPRASSVQAQASRPCAPNPGWTIPSCLLARACLRCERGGLPRPGADLRVCKGSRQPSRLYPVCPIPVIVTRANMTD